MAAQAAGIHRTTLHRWEKGDVQPRLPELEAYLRGIGATAQQRRRALTLLETTQARAVLRVETNALAERQDIPSMPHGGDLLKAMRLRRGFSHEEAAAQVSVTTRTLRKWEAAEVWPNSDALYRLCYHLGAQEAEIVALMTGRAATLPAEENLSFEALQAQWQTMYRTRFQPQFDALRDLAMLAFEAQVWPFATRSSSGRSLLMEVCVEYAAFLWMRERTAEMGKYAARALLLASENSIPVRLYIHAGIYHAHYLSSRQSPRPIARALKAYQSLLPMAQGTDREPWLLSCISGCLMQAGASESSLAFAEQACQVAERLGDPTEYRLRQEDKSNRLQTLKRYEEMLPLLQPWEGEHPYNLTEKLLQLTEAHLGLQNVATAHDYLSQANSLIHASQLLHFQPHAARLAQRF